MTFDELLVLVCPGNSLNICADSRLVRAGDIFIAIKGTFHDGHDFLNQAVENGAKYVVCQRHDAGHKTPDIRCETIIVEDSVKAAAALAQASRGNPASQLINLAVTGTNG